MEHTNMTKQLIDSNKHTNVLAYYIIRCELFQKLPTFLKYCRGKNKDYIKIKNKSHWNSFLQQTTRLTTKSHKLPDFLKNTLRMTVLNHTGRNFLH